MQVIIPISVIALFLSIIASYNKRSYGLEFCFLIVTLIQSIHYNVGSDYMVYYYNFLDFLSGNYSFNELFDEDVIKYNEYGWGVLQWLFGKLFGKNGFFVLVAVLSIVQNLIYYFFIKSHVDRRWWALSVFIYLFTPSFYLLGYSGLRQWFVLSISVVVFMLIENRQYLLAILLVIVGSSIHTSAWVVLLYIILAIIPFKSGKFFGLFYPLLFLLLFLNTNIVESFFGVLFSNDTFEIYSIYQDTQQGSMRSYGLGFILNMVPFLVSCIFLYKSTYNRNRHLLVMISCLGTLVIPFGTMAPLVSRISHYFTILSLSSLPMMYKWIKFPYIRFLCIIILIAISVTEYILFFTQGIFHTSYSDYHTIFSVV